MQAEERKAIRKSIDAMANAISHFGENKTTEYLAKALFDLQIILMRDSNLRKRKK